jgi:hypothetical protein
MVQSPSENVVVAQAVMTFIIVFTRVHRWTYNERDEFSTSKISGSQRQVKWQSSGIERLMVEAICTSETQVYFHETIQSSIPQDFNPVHIHFVT